MKKVEYFNFICFITFKKVDVNAICFSTCTFKKVAILHCRSICLIHFQKSYDVSEVISLGNRRECKLT